MPSARRPGRAQAAQISAVLQKAQRGDELFGKGRPVNGRVGGDVGVVVAHRAVDLAGQLDAGDLRDLALQAGHYVGDFLAQGGR